MTPEGPKPLTPEGPKLLPPVKEKPRRQDGSDVSRGGRHRKRHPGIALREAARLIKIGEKSASEISRVATDEARKRLAAEGLVVHPSWNSGLTSRDDVPKLRAAIEARLVLWTPRTLRVREIPRGPYRDVADLEWLQIPEPE